MSAAAVMLAEAATVPPALVLELRAEARAWLWWRWQIEMDEAVAPLQEFAEQSGIVDELGQDAVQAMLAAPFDRLRAIAAAEEDRREQVWIERHQAAQRAAAAPPAPPKYSTAKSTVDAFWFVVRENNAQHLAAWLADHPRDRNYLQQIWKTKCSAPQK